MGNVLRVIFQDDLRVPTLPCITQPQADTWDERISRNVDQGHKSTHWKLAATSSQWRPPE